MRKLVTILFATALLMSGCSKKNKEDMSALNKIEMTEKLQEKGYNLNEQVLGEDSYFITLDSGDNTHTIAYFSEGEVEELIYRRFDLNTASVNLLDDKSSYSEEQNQQYVDFEEWLTTNGLSIEKLLELFRAEK